MIASKTACVKALLMSVTLLWVEKTDGRQLNIGRGLADGARGKEG